MRVFVAQFAEIVANFRISRCNVFLSYFINLYWKSIFFNFLKIILNTLRLENYYFHVQRDIFISAL